MVTVISRGCTLTRHTGKGLMQKILVLRRIDRPPQNAPDSGEDCTSGRNNNPCVLVAGAREWADDANLNTN
jgi:hypothetical protein